MRVFLLFLAWLAVVAIEVVALRTTPLIPYADDLENELRSDSAAFTRFAAFQEEYAPEDGVILVLFEADDFAMAANHGAASEFLIEAQFLPGAQAVISPFSFSLDRQDETLPLFSGDVDYLALRQRLVSARADLPFLASMLSADLEKMQAVLLIADLPSDTRLVSDIIAQYRALAAEVSATTPIEVTLTGDPMIADAFSRKLDNDTTMLNNVGVVVGLVVAWLALRSLTLALVVALTAHTTRLWSIALLQPFGFAFDAVTITLPTLIVVLAFSEAVHLAMAARRTYHDDRPAPLWRALRAVWPAAFLAALTTSGAFAALYFSPSEMVRNLAFFGMVAILISTPLTLGLICLVAATAERVVDLQRILRPPPNSVGDNAFATLDRRVARHASGLSVAAVLIVVGSAIGYAMLEPDANLFDGVKDTDPEMRALHRIEAEFGPVTTLVFEHPIAPSEDLERARQTLSELSPWGDAFALTQAQIDDLPDLLRDRFVSRDGERTLISVPYAYSGSAQARVDIAGLEARIAQAPALERLGDTTGLVHVTSFVTGDILAAFSLSFALAAVAAGLCIILWLRSLALGLLSVIPNVLPITMVGTIMWLFDVPFNYTSGIALTIAFGVAIDDTVHMINRIRAEAGPGGALSEKVVRRALRGIGPTLVLTSAILIGGLSSTLFSSLTALVSFGALSISVFVLALLADLVLLPALFIWYLRHKGNCANPAQGGTLT